MTIKNSIPQKSVCTTMGYDTSYTITITANTKKRRREIAAEIVKCAWLPYESIRLDPKDFKDPILEFQNRGWRNYELLDLGGMWYDRHLHLEDKDLGTIRGITLKDGERIHLIGYGDDDEDVYRIVATPTYIVSQRAKVTFVDKVGVCPNYDEDNDNCSGCQSCATRDAKFPKLEVESEYS